MAPFRIVIPPGSRSASAAFELVAVEDGLAEGLETVSVSVAGAPWTAAEVAIGDAAATEIEYWRGTLGRPAGRYVVDGRRMSGYFEARTLAAARLWLRLFLRRRRTWAWWLLRRRARGAVHGRGEARLTSGHGPLLGCGSS